MRSKNFALLLGLAALTAQARFMEKAEAPREAPSVEFVDGEFVVKVKKSSGITAKVFSTQLQKIGMKVVESISSTEELYLLKSEAASFKTQEAQLQSLKDLKDVEFAEPNFIYRILGQESKATDDPNFNKLWALENTGQADSEGTLGKAGADIKASTAWTLGTGSKTVVVGVIDTGVDIRHADLSSNIWSHPQNPSIHSYDAITGGINPIDDNSHGTHCSGTIGASGNNSLGIVGVNWNVSIMGAKFLSAQGSGTLANAVKAIDWAVDNGAKILSNSWGGGGYSQALKDAISRSHEKGVLFVVAAGNNSSDLDVAPHYPASYDVPNVLSVAASTNLDNIASFSNFGKNSVHLMAPGHNILSTIPSDRYDSYSGTSMATPHVAGAAALLWAKEPQLSALEIKARILSSTDKAKSLRNKLISAGRLNIYNLLMNIEGPGFVEIPSSAWSPLVAQPIVTEHPYRNGTSQRWTIEKPGATFMKLYFSKFSVEQGYDSVKIIDGNTSEVIEVLSGPRTGAFWTSEIESSRVIVELNTDISVSDYGFDLDGFSWTDFRVVSDRP